MAQIEKRMMKRKIRQFNARSKYWKYWSGRSIELFLLPKDLGNIKRKKFRSVMLWSLHSSWSCFVSLPKGENR
jgi:hypothetical protein